MNYYVVKAKPTLQPPLHIGKASSGQRFLFHDVNCYDTEWEVELHTYRDWIRYLQEMVVMKGEVVILDEYENCVYYHELINIIQEMQTNDISNSLDEVLCEGYRFYNGEFR